MKTAIVISTRGFSLLRPDLLVDPDSVRFVGIFSDADGTNLPDQHREFLHETHLVPCGAKDPTDMLLSLVDEAAAADVVRRVLATTPLSEVSLHCYDEQNMLVAASLRTAFDISGPKYKDILPFRDKVLMKELVAEAGLRVPRFGRFQPASYNRDAAAYFAELVDDVGLPFILKPIDSAAGEGVVRVESERQFLALPPDLGREYEYEEFIEGTMYSVNIVTRNGESVFCGVTEYLVNSTDVQKGKVNADVNLIDHDRRVARMVGFAETALAALGQPDTSSHLELFRTDSDELIFLEVGARFKGLAGLAAMQLHYGVALVNLALEIEAGIPSRCYDHEQVYCFDAVIPRRHGVVAELVEPDIQSEFTITWKVKPGDLIEKSNSLLANGGTLLIKNHDYDVLYEDFFRLVHYEPIRYQ